MKVKNTNVAYSSIVKIGEQITELEKTSNQKYLKLHRGVIDVDIIDLDSVIYDFNYNHKSIQHYGSNDGDPDLINLIKQTNHLENHHLIMTPGGMSGLDIVINSLDEKEVWIPKYHWGSWSKILKLHNKYIKEFDDFHLENTSFLNDIKDGIIMMCFPSNPTGWIPDLKTLQNFLKLTQEKNIPVILDLPYYNLFFDSDNEIYKSYYDNVILVSSFSKSLGLSGFRVGYVATKNKELYESLKIRSLYKYNSISTIPQKIIYKLLSTTLGNELIESYQRKTTENIYQNIQYLKQNNLLFDEYPSTPIGPFVIINLDSEFLLKNYISSVPLNKFSLNKDVNSKYSRISVAVKNRVFVSYFENIK